MITLAVIVAIIIGFTLIKRAQHNTVAARTSLAQQKLHTSVFRSRKHWIARLHACREDDLWIAPISDIALRKIRAYILSTLHKIQPTNWDEYLFDAIRLQLPHFYVYLTDDGDFDFDKARHNETKGINDATEAVARTCIYHADTLREYFHVLFKNISASAQMNNECYFRGQMRVIMMLRSYQASTGVFTRKAACSDDESHVGIFGKLAGYFGWLKVERRKNRLVFNRGYPIIEFDLERIKYADVFKHEGSLLNSLFLYLKEVVNVATANTAPEHRLATEQKYDVRYLGYSYAGGMVWIVKCTALVQEYPHCLYIEFQDVPPDAPCYRELYNLKLYLEANN